MPMSIGCKTEVALGGKNTSFILDKSWICGCAGQLSTRSKIFLFFRLNLLFHLLKYCWKISEVIHAFLLAENSTRSFFTFLKQRGVCDSPITKSLFLSDWFVMNHCQRFFLLYLIGGGDRTKCLRTQESITDQRRPADQFRSDISVKRVRYKRDIFVLKCP
jgi:hypothetical protein